MQNRVTRYRRTLQRKMRTKAFWLDNSVALGAKAKKPWVEQLREFGRNYGYYGALAVLLCVLGIASVQYRNKDVQTPTEEISASEYDFVNAVLTPSIEPTPFVPTWTMPVQGEIVREFSPNRLIWSETLGQWQTHGGTDIACQAGEAVYAPADGIVTQAYRDALFGYVIEIDHGEGWVSRCAGLGGIQLAEVGKKVRGGDVISAADNTAICESNIGTHVHLELYHDGEAVDAAEWMR